MVEELIPALESLSEDEPLMIALVGAGGKTTAMLALAQYYAAMGRSVLVATTTRIYAPAENFIHGIVLRNQRNDVNLRAERGAVTVFAEAAAENGKLLGVSPEVLDRIYETKAFNVILVEADGAGGRSLKAPADHEPVIPAASTHVIGIIGMDAIGQPADRSHVHRLERFLAVTGIGAYQLIDSSALIKLIASPEGLFKNAPNSASRILLLNKCADERLKDIADRLISKCLEQGIGGLAQGVRL